MPEFAIVDAITLVLNKLAVFDPVEPLLAAVGTGRVQKQLVMSQYATAPREQQCYL